MIRPLHDQVMVITGASSGIGRTTAREAARRGTRVVLAARNGSTLDEAVQAIRDDGGQAAAAPTDVTDPVQVEHLARQASEMYGRIDTWVNAAAVTVYGAARDVPVEDVRRVMEVTFLGQVHCAKAALPYLEETGGALICIGSALSDRGAPLQTAYSAAKHALKGWLDGLRVELLHQGSPVRVTLIKPASINTPFFAKARTYMGVRPKPLPPVYAPELVAQAILHAAQARERDLFVGGAGKALSLGERTSPRLLDAQMLRMGFDEQRTDRPAGPDDPNNLYATIRDDGGEHGEFDAGEKRRSFYQPIAEHTTASSIAAAAALGIGALAVRGMRSRRGRAA